MAMARATESAVEGAVLRTPPDDAWALHRWEPSAVLAPYVVWHWAVVWDLGGRPPHRQLTLPHPSAHVCVEDGVARLYGPLRGRFERELRGAGRVVATRLRPGALGALLGGAPATSLVDRVVDADVLPGLDGAALAAAVDAEPALEAAAGVLGARLEALLPAAPDPAIAIVDRALALLEEDRSLTRVGPLAARLGTSTRTLQRVFARYVGVGPAWVVRRRRLQEAAAQAVRGGAVDWARLAVELGYADQAHLVRDFTAVVGEPPARYAAGG